ncbi:MAG: hypothetical protein R2801_02145 [Chitinophagales bacterium]
MKHFFLLILIFVVGLNVFSKDIIKKYNKYNILSDDYLLHNLKSYKNSIKSFTIKQHESNNNEIWSKFNFDRNGNLTHVECSAYRFNKLEDIRIINYYHITDINLIPKEKSIYNRYSLIMPMIQSL